MKKFTTESVMKQVRAAFEASGLSTVTGRNDQFRLGIASRHARIAPRQSPELLSVERTRIRVDSRATVPGQFGDGSLFIDNQNQFSSQDFDFLNLPTESAGGKENLILIGAAEIPADFGFVVGSQLRVEHSELEPAAPESDADWRRSLSA